MGHEVYFALRPTNEWQGRLDFLSPERFMHNSIRNSFGTFNARRIGRFVEENEIDLVHAHVARDYLAASIACRVAKRAKLVLTRHAMVPLKPFHRFALRNVDAAIAVSPGIQDYLERTFPASRISLIPNGTASPGRSIDIRKASGTEFRSFHNIGTDAPLIATMGELTVAKGQRDFVLAANEVVKTIPNCRFVIAGKDDSMDQKFRRELKRLVRVLGLEDRFLWLDRLQDPIPLFAAADVFVSPSHYESFGHMILEAIAVGTPVIATETDGAREVLRYPDLLVPVKDPVALAKKICWLMENVELRRDIVERFKLMSAQMFSPEQMIKATERVYCKVLNI